MSVGQGIAIGSIWLAVAALAFSPAPPIAMVIAMLAMVATIALAERQ